MSWRSPENISFPKPRDKQAICNAEVAELVKTE